MIFANTLFAFLSVDEIIAGNKIFLAIRIVAGIFGAILGWYLAWPLFAGLYRLIVHKAMPFLLLIPLRLAAAAVAGAAVFLFLPLGPGGGFGWPGGSGGSGGNGNGNNNGTTDGGSLSSKPGKQGVVEKPGLDKVDIELLGGRNYKGEGKYYRLQTKDGESVMNLKEVESFFDERKNKVAVNLHLTDESIEGQPRVELREMILMRKIKLTINDTSK